MRRILSLLVLLPWTSALAAEAAKEPAPAAEHAYAPVGKRDPFQEREVKVVFPPPGPECGTLCTFDVTEFRLSAVVTGTTSPLAGLEAPNGKVYIVDKGTKVGKRHGRVLSIASGKVVVEEPCAKDSAKRCRTELVLPAAPAADEEDLQRKK